MSNNQGQKCVYQSTSGYLCDNQGHVYLSHNHGQRCLCVIVKDRCICLIIKDGDVHT